MLLLVGLGNPGPKYSRHRHSVGFRIADAIHARHRFGPWKKNFSAEIAEADIAGERVLLMKPTTYMNESGRAVAEAMRFYKLEPGNVVVIYDELDLPPGKTRIKTGGGAAGHNGIRSVAASIGLDFRRLRVGIGHPGHRELVHGYVLHDFAKADEAWLVPLIDAIAENVPLLVRGEDNSFANRLHAATKGPDEPEAGGGPPAPKRPPPKKGPDGSADASPPAAPPEAGEGPFARLRRLFGGS
ncbi:MAG: aminoacyl-tRNA hydrolase [Bauldia sp.]|nr:aminoacyl-tRNA hydrolase [Bauldia sp.]